VRATHSAKSIRKVALLTTIRYKYF